MVNKRLSKPIKQSYKQLSVKLIKIPLKNTLLNPSIPKTNSNNLIQTFTIKFIH